MVGKIMETKALTKLGLAVKRRGVASTKLKPETHPCFRSRAAFDVRRLARRWSWKLLFCSLGRFVFETAALSQVGNI